MQMHDIITQAYMHSAVYNMIKVASQWWLLQATDLLCKVMSFLSFRISICFIDCWCDLGYCWYFSNSDGYYYCHSYLVER